jgi:hypothetical protein
MSRENIKIGIMKKVSFMLLVLVLMVGFLYLVYKTWNVFGFWTLIWTGLVLLIANISLWQLISSRKETNDEIMYNPKEWPKFLSCFISLCIGSYLYSIIDKPAVSKFDFIFGLSYILIFIFIPVWIAGYNLVYNRNDFISISKTSVKYKDNQELGEFQIDNIRNVELSGNRIKLTLMNDEVRIIKTDQMNFNYKDLRGVVNDIKNRI